MRMLENNSVEPELVVLKSVRVHLAAGSEALRGTTH